MNSFSNTILQQTQPDYWDSTDYSNVCYKTFRLIRYSVEFRKIQKEFLRTFGDKYQVKEIKRIQHPFAYVSCQLMRKQLSVIQNTNIPEESRIFYCVCNIKKLGTFLEYNCEERKATCVAIKQMLKKRLPPSGCVVMAKKISGSSPNLRSSNRYPDYLIKYKVKTYSDDLSEQMRNLSLNN